MRTTRANKLPGWPNAENYHTWPLLMHPVSSVLCDKQLTGTELCGARGFRLSISILGAIPWPCTILLQIPMGRCRLMAVCAWRHALWSHHPHGTLHPAVEQEHTSECRPAQSQHAMGLCVKKCNEQSALHANSRWRMADVDCFRHEIQPEGRLAWVSYQFPAATSGSNALSPISAQGAASSADHHMLVMSMVPRSLQGHWGFAPQTG